MLRGVQTLFVTLFEQEQQHWIKLIGKALRYNELWSLKPDSGKITGKRGEGAARIQSNDEPLKKRRKLSGKTKNEQQIAVISHVTQYIVDNWDQCSNCAVQFSCFAINFFWLQRHSQRRTGIDERRNQNKTVAAPLGFCVVNGAFEEKF